MLKCDILCKEQKQLLKCFVFFLYNILNYLIETERAQG